MSIEFNVFNQIKIPVAGCDSTNITYLDDDAIKINQDVYGEVRNLSFSICQIDNLIESLIFAKKMFTCNE